LISDITKGQIDSLNFTGRPLVICDVDEVIVHFTRDFEDYIAAENLWLDTASFALAGNIRCRTTDTPETEDRVASLVSEFFATRTRHMQPIDGAIDALLEFGSKADVILLTNLPHSSGDLRRKNLADHGIPYPVVTNSGPKGPAIRSIVDNARQPEAVFIDDSPSFIASAYEHAPDVHLVHFLHDDRFARHIEPLSYVSLRTGNWLEARSHVLEIIS
jgi:hypothetical protein